MRMVAGSRPVLVIAWEWHIGLALLCGCSGALEYPTTNSCRPINKSLSYPYPYPYPYPIDRHTALSEISNRTVGKNIAMHLLIYHAHFPFWWGVYKYCCSVYGRVWCGDEVRSANCARTMHFSNKSVNSKLLSRSQKSSAREDYSPDTWKLQGDVKYFAACITAQKSQ